MAAAAIGGRRAIFGPPVTHGHSGPYTYGMSRSRSNNNSSSGGSSIDDGSLGSLRNGSGGHSQQKASSSPYAPLYENSEMTYSARQPAGRPVMPIR